MTLVLGIATPWGMWQSADHRLLELPGHKGVSEVSRKHLAVKAPDGAAIVGYAGIGRFNGEDTSDWLRKTLRGEDRLLEEIGDEIASRATDEISPLALSARPSVPHFFVMSAFLRGEPFVALIANTESPFGDKPVQREFKVMPFKVDVPVPVSAGGGFAAVSEADRELLQACSAKRPRRPADYLGLLASVNQRAAESGHPAAALISSGCLATSLVPEGTFQTEYLGEGPSGAWVPLLLSGIDMTEMMTAMPRFDPETRTWSEVDEEAHEAAARRSIEPRKPR